MVAGVGGIKPQIKLRLRKKNKNIVLENIDKYNKSKLLKLLSDCYLDMEVLASYQGEIDDEGEPVSISDYIAWQNNHLNDIPEGLNKTITTLLNNGIYPKLCYTYGYDEEKFSFVSSLTSFYTNKINIAWLEYLTINTFLYLTPMMQRVNIVLTPDIYYCSAQLSNIETKIARE